MDQLESKAFVMCRHGDATKPIYGILPPSGVWSWARNAEALMLKSTTSVRLVRAYPESAEVLRNITRDARRCSCLSGKKRRETMTSEPQMGRQS